MSWRDRLQRASFRGVEFRVEAHSSGSGRRLVVHQFPGLDAKLIQDFGRDTDVVRMRAYVIGPDYDRQRDALLAACREQGAGTLVHPYLGELEVRCTEFRVEERSAVGGVALLTLTFIEAGGTAEGLFTDATDPQGDAEAAAETLRLVAVDSWAARLGTLEAAGRSADAIAAELEGLAAVVQTAPLAGPISDLARLRRDATRVADGAITLLGAPGELAASVRDLVVSFAAAFESRRARVEAMLGLLETIPTRPSTPVSGLFSERRTAAAATSELIRALAAAEALEQAILVPWSHLEEAQSVLERLRDGVDALTATADDATFGALRDLMAAAPDVLPPAPESLPSLEELCPGRTVPALVLSYERYGTAARETELLERNPQTITHPGRVAGDAVLEALSR